MKTLFIHIGMEKTGTTTLQAYLRNNSMALSDQDFWYPVDRSKYYVQESSHGPIVGNLLSVNCEFLSERKNLTKLNALEQFILDASSRDEKNVIISSEHFSSRIDNIDILLNFKIRLSKCFHEIKIVIYIRNQIELASSAYSTAVRCGRRKAFSVDEVDPSERYFNILGMLENWSAVFGLNNIIIKEYKVNALREKNICKDFCDLINIDHSNLDLVSDQNVSLSLNSIEVLREINNKLPHYTDDYNAYHNSQELRSCYIEPYLRRNSDSRFILNEFDRIKIQNKFLEHNIEINNKFMNQNLSENWFPSKNKSNFHPFDEIVQQSKDQPTLTKGQCDLSDTFSQLVVDLAEDLRRYNFKPDPKSKMYQKIQKKFRNRLIVFMAAEAAVFALVGYLTEYFY